VCLPVREHKGLVRSQQQQQQQRRQESSSEYLQARAAVDINSQRIKDRVVDVEVLSSRTSLIEDVVTAPLVRLPSLTLTTLITPIHSQDGYQPLPKAHSKLSLLETEQRQTRPQVDSQRSRDHSITAITITKQALCPHLPLVTLPLTAGFVHHAHVKAKPSKHKVRGIYKSDMAHVAAYCGPAYISQTSSLFFSNMVYIGKHAAQSG